MRTHLGLAVPVAARKPHWIPRGVPHLLRRTDAAHALEAVPYLFSLKQSLQGSQSTTGGSLLGSIIAFFSSRIAYRSKLDVIYLSVHSKL